MELLKELVFCHATPGDERAVADVLRREWQACGWKVNTIGHYAVLAKSPQWDEERPTVMFCAHMDAPGFIIQAQGDDTSYTAVTLGYPHKEDSAPVPVSVKTADGLVRGKIEQFDNAWQVTCDDKTRLSRGDRLCFSPQFSVEKDLIQATALDNRIGCWLLARFPWLLQEQMQAVNVIVAATGQEEMTGFGAAVLAAQVRCELTICLDATYTSEEQGVRLGGGPVLTVSDKSTLQSPEVCRFWEQMCRNWGIPLQKEIYNYSGTDARAFPEAGAMQPVFAILVPSEGNHTPVETVSHKDVRILETLLQKLSTDASWVPEIYCDWLF